MLSIDCCSNACTACPTGSGVSGDVLMSMLGPSSLTQGVLCNYTIAPELGHEVHTTFFQLKWRRSGAHN